VRRHLPLQVVLLLAPLAAPGCGDDTEVALEGSTGTETTESSGDADVGSSTEGSETTDAAPGCVDGRTECDGSCVDLQADRDHCGACDVVCSVEQVCDAGACETSCAQGRTVCDGACVDTQSDRDNCGACGDACEAGEVCDAGACALSCGGDTPDVCGGGCFDLQSDPQRCGACDAPCAGGASCSEGSCACPGDQEVCDEACVDTQSDAAHCGGCGSPCGEGEVCNAGACTTSCPVGQTACEGQCVDVLSDPLHCNGCGTPCGDGEACVEGTCTPSCAEPLIACDDACIDPLNDPNYCGDCTTSCAGEGAVGVCLDGGCDLLCLDGRANCDDAYDTGCETDLTADNANCGGCGVVCDATCTPGGCVRHVFVTDAISNGNLGGLAGADATCQAEADAAGLAGTYLAWLSTDTTSPAERFVQSTVPYLRPDGLVVAEDWADLTDGSLQAPISLNAAGAAPAAPVCPLDRVWTNTTTDGTRFNTSWTCNNWTTGGAVGHAGDMGQTGGDWTAETGAACSVSNHCGSGQEVGARLYCFQQ
jgi:hypothetical protein